MSDTPPRRAVSAAFVFLTRIPVPGEFTDEDFRRSSGYFPVVGVVVGVLGAVVFTIARPLGAAIAACLAVAATALLTGAMHEDGLADTADALFGGATYERVLAIAKDPRLGSFGVVTLVMVLATRLACVSSLEGKVVLGFLLAHTFSRFAATATMAMLPYVRDDGSGKSRDVTGTTLRDLGVAAIAPGVVVAIAVVTHGIGILDLVVVLAAASIVAYALGRWFDRRIGGIVGDFLGATIQLVDLTVWLSIAAVST